MQFTIYFLLHVRSPLRITQNVLIENADNIRSN